MDPIELSQEAIEALNATGLHWVVLLTDDAHNRELGGIGKCVALDAHETVNLLIQALVNTRYWEMRKIREES